MLEPLLLTETQANIFEGVELTFLTPTSLLDFFKHSSRSNTETLPKCSVC